MPVSNYFLLLQESGRPSLTPLPEEAGHLQDRAGAIAKVSSLHSKTMIVYRRESTIGSYNWDPRSGIWNPEIMIVIDDTGFAEELVDYMQPLWSPEVSWVVGELQQPIGL